MRQEEDRAPYRGDHAVSPDRRLTRAVRAALCGATRPPATAASLVAIGLLGAAAQAHAAEFPPVFELSVLAEGDGSSGFVLNGVEVLDEVGTAAVGIGDLNGDGIADFLIGTDNEDVVAGEPGQAYVVFGRTEGFAAEVELAAIESGDGSEGVVLNGVSNFLRTTAAQPAGDVNGDGFDDLIIGSPTTAPEGGLTVTGVAYVVYGTDQGFPPAIDLPTLDGNQGFELIGIDIGDYAGDAVSGLGDVNADGLDDFIIGARDANQPEGDFDAGEAYVVFGNRQGFPANFPLAFLAINDGSRGFQLNGVDREDRTGVGVGSAGDFNGDGVNDILVSAPFAGDGGEVYLVYGSPLGFPPVFELSALASGDGSAGAVFSGTDGDAAGYSVSTVGDFNGDGLDDIIISQRDGAYLVFGSTDPLPAEFDLASLAAGDGTAGVFFNGMDVEQAAAAGDLNNDGFADILLSNDVADIDGRTFIGRTYVVFGSSQRFPAVFNVNALAGADGSRGFVLDGVDEIDRSGYAIGGTGDVNGDGVDDIAIGAFGADPNDLVEAGEAYVVFGRPARPSFAVEGIATFGAICRNLTLPQVIVIPSPGEGLSANVFCGDSASFAISEGDQLQVTAIGDNFGLELAGRVVGATGATALCTNVTRSDSVEVTIGLDGRWDCAAAGLTLESGDRVNVVLSAEAL